MLSLLSAPNYTALWWSLGGVAVAGLLFAFVFCLVASHQIYIRTLRRGGNNDWTRGHASLSDAESLGMYNGGMAWREQNLAAKRDVHIVNQGLNLYGEYYDFGHERCVIILPGRSENSEYCCYFARPYEAIGFNVLVIDPRAHGFSDGIYNTVGFDESSDALAWAKYIHDTYHIKQIVFHGICIGSATAMYVLTSKDCPDYIAGMTGEGMFVNFGESVKQHLIERKKPLFPVLALVNMWMKHFTGHSMKKGPLDVIDKMNKPLLMLHSKEDRYSLPALAQKLYDRAPTEQKELVWFEHGAHSMIRINNTAQYDEAIRQFVKKYY